MECLTKQIFSSASDVWSFGVLMWELFNPHVKPYRKMDNMTVIAAVSAGQRLDIPEKMSADGGDRLCRLAGMLIQQRDPASLS